MVTWRSLTWVSLVFGTQITQRTPLELLGIWLLRLCASSPMVLLLTILPWALLAMNACSEGDHTQVETEEKSENIFLLSKFKSRELKFHRVGLLKQLTLLTGLFRENLWTDLALMVQRMLKTTHGLEISLGMTCLDKKFHLLSFLQTKITLMPTTPTVSGKIKTVNKYNKTCSF